MPAINAPIIMGIWIVEKSNENVNTWSPKLVINAPADNDIANPVINKGTLRCFNIEKKSAKMFENLDCFRKMVFLPVRLSGFMREMGM